MQVSNNNPQHIVYDNFKNTKVNNDLYCIPIVSTVSLLIKHMKLNQILKTPQLMSEYKVERLLEKFPSDFLRLTTISQLAGAALYSLSMLPFFSIPIVVGTYVTIASILTLDHIVKNKLNDKIEEKIFLIKLRNETVNINNLSEFFSSTNSDNYDEHVGFFIDFKNRINEFKNEKISTNLAERIPIMTEYNNSIRDMDLKALASRGEVNKLLHKLCRKEHENDKDTKKLDEKIAFSKVLISFFSNISVCSTDAIITIP